MTLPEQITTVKQFHQSTLKEKGSEFIAQIYPIRNHDDFETIINSVRKKFYDASHHCYAYKLSDDSKKYSDDGEPSGTAGIRILNAIEHFNLSNALVVIIRYFGGTKLGVGPLGKAYYSSAIQVIDESEHIKMILMEKITIKLPPSFISNIYRIVSNLNGKVEQTRFEQFLEVEIIIPPKNVDSLKNDLKDATKGDFELFRSSEPFYI